LVTHDLLRRTSNGIIVPGANENGLPPKIYVPIFAIIAIAFLGTMAYLVSLGFGVTGSVFGKSAQSAPPPATARQGSQNAVEGGPPAPVAAQLQTLRSRIAAHPNDDVAITQLADMYLAANKFQEAIPLYRQALRVNPHNVAAQTGLAQAQAALRQ
jgi:cytochrome c-type biogenesis protein CcmH/NrfG